MIKKTIRFKMVLWVLLVVAAGFVAVIVITGDRVTQILQQNILSSEELRLQQYIQHIEYMQDSTENFGKQIAADKTFQLLYVSDDGLETYPKNKKDSEIASFLRQHLLMRSDCYQIDLVYPDGSYFTSNARDSEDYYDKDYYRNFKQEGRGRGYVGIYDVTMLNSWKKNQALFYIFSTRYIENLSLDPIDIVIAMDQKLFLGEYSIEDEPVQAFALYNSFGEILAGTGVLSEDAQSCLEESDGTGTVSCGNGNILLIRQDSKKNWTAVLEISRELLEKEMRGPLMFITGIMFVDCGVLLAVLFNIILRILRPIESLKAASREIGEGHLQTELDIRSGDEFEELGAAFNRMGDNLQRYMAKMLEYEKVKKDMEIDKLVLQINPHFIYNTLNTISYMAEEEGNDRIGEFTRAFIALLQDSVTVSKKTHFTTLGQEILNVKNYVVLQKYRYEDKFELAVQVPGELLGCQVPGILLQPIVENAIFHGILAREGRGHIAVTARQEEGKLYIEVSDDGAGMSPETLEEILQERKMLNGSMRKIGTGNVKNRIRYIYGEPYGLEIHSVVGRGTTVRLCLPCEYPDEDVVD